MGCRLCVLHHGVDVGRNLVPALEVFGVEGYDGVIVGAHSWGPGYGRDVCVDGVDWGIPAFKFWFLVACQFSDSPLGFVMVINLGIGAA